MRADDGIVVGEVEKGDGQMDSNTVPAALWDRLGPEGTDGLVRLFETARAEWTGDVVNLSAERFERRLVQELATLRVETARGRATLREEVARQGAALRVEMVTNRFELLKWSFVFWVGQVIAMAGLMAAMLSAFGPAR